MTEQARHTKDGRRKWLEPCAYGHTIQAMECPSCAEKLGYATGAEWVRWYERRYNRKPTKRRTI